MRPNRLKRALREGRPQVGLFCSVPDPLVVEMIACAGFDFVILDAEHTLVNPETLAHLIRAVEAGGLTPLVRVAEGTRPAILQALDGGAQGVVVPHVRSAAEAAAAVAASRYFPAGRRSLDAGRTARFGDGDLTAHLAEANAETIVAVMIEDEQGVERIDEILAVPGIDLVLAGAADLSQAYGVPWQTRSGPVLRALERIHDSARRRGVAFCAVARVPEDVAAWHERGVCAFVFGEARNIAFRAFRDLREGWAAPLRRPANGQAEKGNRTEGAGTPDGTRRDRRNIQQNGKGGEGPCGA